MSNMVRFNAPTNRGPSVAIWGDMAKWRADQDRGMCHFFFDDFITTGISVSGGSTTYHGNLTVVADAGLTLNHMATQDLSVFEAGVLKTDGMETDNDEVYMTVGSVSGGSFKFDATYPECKIAFECRVKKQTVSNNQLSFFAGLARYDLAAAGTLVDDTTALIATFDGVGFHQPDADGDGADAVFMATGQTMQTVLSDAATLTADTWIKLGFLYDCSNSLKALRFFVDGVEKAATTASAVYATALDDATFPDNIVVSPLIGIKLDGTTEVDFYVDWWAAGQYHVSSD